MQQELLSDGAVRIAGANCRFVCLRLRPGTILTVVNGHDTGEFGRWLADFIEAELRRFGIPVSWFIDAAEMEGASHEVFLQWIAWLGSKPAALRRVDAFVQSERARLTMSIAQHLASAEDAMILHTDRERWIRVLRRSVPGWTDLSLQSRFNEPAADTRRTVAPDGSVVITSHASKWMFRRASSAVVFSTFEGDDIGALAHLPFDELLSQTANGTSKLAWFVDLSRGRTVASSVVEEWTQWLTAHRDRFSTIGMLAPANALPLVLAIAKYRSGTDKLVVYRSPDEFHAALQSRVKSTATVAR